MHRTVLNMARCMFFNCGLPICFCGDAVKYAADVLNRSPNQSGPGRKSTIELLEKKPPSLLHIVDFGSTRMVYRESNDRSSKKRVTRGIIVGIPEETKGFVVYLMKAQKIDHTQHVRNIKNLSKEQNATLLDSPSRNEELGIIRNGGAVSPANQPEPQHAGSRVTARTPDQRKPSRRLRDALASCVKAIEAIDQATSVFLQQRQPWRPTH
jgi:hypothetical protein